MTLGFQGLTGVGYVEMAGGSPQLPPIWEAQASPTIIATRSSMQDLLAGARTILSRADEVLQTLERTVSDNSDDISLAVLDMRKFTSALAENSDDVASFVSNVSAAAKGIADATGKLDGIISKSEALLDAVDPEDVSATLKSIRTTSESLAAQADRIGPLVDHAERRSGQRRGVLRASAGARREGRDAGRRDRSGEGVARPRQYRALLQGARSDNSDDIDQIVANARAVSERFDTLGERAESLLTKLDSMAGQGPGGIMQDATDTLAAIRAAADNFNAQMPRSAAGSPISATAACATFKV